MDIGEDCLAYAQPPSTNPFEQVLAAMVLFFPGTFKNQGELYKGRIVADNQIKPDDPYRD